MPSRLDVGRSSDSKLTFGGVGLMPGNPQDRPPCRYTDDTTAFGDQQYLAPKTDVGYGRVTIKKRLKMEARSERLRKEAEGAGFMKGRSRGCPEDHGVAM